MKKDYFVPHRLPNKVEKNLADYHMSLVLRKPVFEVSDQVPYKPGCTATEDGWKLEISVTAKLICVFVFAYAKSRFSHDAAHIFRYVYYTLVYAYGAVCVHSI